MPELSPRDRANQAHTLVLQKLPLGTATKVAEAMGISDKDMSEIKNKQLAPVLYLLAHLGYKLVPSDSRCMKPKDFDYLTSLHLRIARKAPELFWEDSELGTTGHGALGGPE